ncbi:MAG: DUF3427 domain-containing protein, partial [Ignavibacteria bacterium]
MEKFEDSLLQSLRTGFIDQYILSNNEYLPKLLVNDKSIGTKILTTIEHELRKCNEFWFSVAFATAEGVASIINTLQELDQKNIKGRILVSQYLNFTEPEALRKLLQFKNIDLKISTSNNFHSKGYLFRQTDFHNLIIGSSNLTANALSINTEWNLKISAITNSSIIFNSINEFKSEFEKAITVDNEFISNYEKIYSKRVEYSQLLKDNKNEYLIEKIVPNKMQTDALNNIEQLRALNKNKALLISATGTGKTYLSAFDVKNFNPKKFLFVVHRTNIARTSMEAFKTIIGDGNKMGIYSGSVREIEKDYLFSTIQTISRDEHLKKFSTDHFDYIVIDETHRAGADSYQKVIDYFKPKFLLGMTATPERTDGNDIFKYFDHNIAYEIRLIKALEENMLSPFHYYGVTDISVNGEVLDDNSDFTKLAASERINNIIEKSKFYGTDVGVIRGLIFCSRVEECIHLSNEFNDLGFKTIALTGISTEEERSEAIKLIEKSENSEDKIDYIFTVDIFNEGIDIPKINQIIMLRPTQSAIIFVQQLGRGLRKAENKEYLTVIDFIGNYSNNYLVPIALYGDNSYNKDTLRKLMTSGSSLIPGTSTINFDKISRERIFESIDSAKMNFKRDLLKDYNLLKFKLGRIPMMNDYVDHGSRDPMLYVEYSKSYFNFVSGQEILLNGKLNELEGKLLELFSSEINNSKRVEESLILLEIINNERISIDTFKKKVEDEFGYNVSDQTIDSCILNLNFHFITENKNNKMLSLNEILGVEIIEREKNILSITDRFKKLLENKTFEEFLLDSTEYSIDDYKRKYDKSKFFKGFVLYRKYSRKDVFRILNWDRNPIAHSVGGYMFS